MEGYTFLSQSTAKNVTINNISEIEVIGSLIMNHDLNQILGKG